MSLLSHSDSCYIEKYCLSVACYARLSDITRLSDPADLSDPKSAV
jgi:hypothetical protein